jgi:hypothetical protein
LYEKIQHIDQIQNTILDSSPAQIARDQQYVSTPERKMVERYITENIYARA